MVHLFTGPTKPVRMWGGLHSLEDLLSVLRKGCRLSMKRQLGDFAYFPQNNRFLPEFRRSIVDWMFKCKDTCRISDLTIENAIRLFDSLLMQVVLRNDQLQPAALACIFISSKLHETHALSFDLVKSHFHEIISWPQLMTYENDILTSVQWETSTFTSVQFVLAVTLLITDPQMLEIVRDTALRMLQDIALPRYDVALMNPCHVGVAVICAACKYRGLQYHAVVQNLNAYGIPVMLDEKFMEQIFVLWGQREVSLANAERMRAALERRVLTPTIHQGHSQSAQQLARHGVSGLQPSYFTAARASATSPATSEIATITSDTSCEGSAELLRRAQSAEGGSRSRAREEAEGGGAKTSMRVVRARAWTEGGHDASSMSRCLSAPIAESDCEEDMLQYTPCGAAGGSAGDTSMAVTERGEEEEEEEDSAEAESARGNGQSRTTVRSSPYSMYPAASMLQALSLGGGASGMPVEGSQ